MPRFVIAPASTSDIAMVRELWREYWETLGFGYDFQDFATELDSLPGAYAPPAGCLLLASVDGEPAGTGALRALSPPACEAKRVYLRPQYRGCGLGGGVMQRLIEEARSAGYREMFADTLPSMTAALRLYRELGFRETAAYSPKPTPGAVFLRLSL